MSLLAGLSQQGDSIAAHNADAAAHGITVSANAGSVVASPYGLTLATTVNTAGNREFITIRNATRIRSGGKVISIRLNSNITVDTVETRVKFWRYSGGVYTLVGRSEDLKAAALAIGTGAMVRTIPISTPIYVQEGDYVSVYSNIANPSFITSTAGYDSKYCAGEAADGTDWVTGFTTMYAVTLSVEVNVEPPHIVYIGDSICAGHPGNNSMLEASKLDGINFPELASESLSARWQNLGIGGQTTTQIAARFAADVVAAKPRYCVIEGGPNDLVLAVSAADAINNYRSMLRQCRGAGIIPILIKQTPWTNGSESRTTTGAGEADGTTVVCSALTGAATANYYKHWWVTVGSETRQVTGSASGGVLTVSPAFSTQVATSSAFFATAMTERDARWESIAALAASFPEAILIDLDVDLGKTNTNGPAGNLWDIQTELASGGVHFNDAGNVVIAAAVVREIRKQWRTPVFT